MDVPLLIRHRLKELGLEQKDLAAAAQVTESYVSQLLAGKKTPPAPARSGIYDKIGKFLKLPKGELSKLAEFQRREHLRKKVADPPIALFKKFRELILRKCIPSKREEVRGIVEKDAFGEFERLVTQKLLDVAQGIAKEKLESDEWLRRLAQLSDRSHQRTRAGILQLLDTDVFNISIENCVPFLEPLIESWDIDRRTFAVEIVLNQRLSPLRPRRFEFVEKDPEGHIAIELFTIEPGLDEFLKDRALSGDATEEEIGFLKTLKFTARRPSPIYYYRELQNLRDPLHFHHRENVREEDHMATGTTPKRQEDLSPGHFITT